MSEWIDGAGLDENSRVQEASNESFMKEIRRIKRQSLGRLVLGMSFMVAVIGGTLELESQQDNKASFVDQQVMAQAHAAKLNASNSAVTVRIDFAEAEKQAEAGRAGLLESRNVAFRIAGGVALLGAAVMLANRKPKEPAPV